MQPTAELETFTAPENYWEPIIQHCLKRTRFKDLSSLRADIDERVDRLITEEFGSEGWRPCGMGAQSEDYDRLAFLKVLRQPAECDACKAGKKPPIYCDSGGKLFEVFRRGDKVYVWFRPGLCQTWLRANAQQAQREAIPVEMGRRGFGR